MRKILVFGALLAFILGMISCSSGSGGSSSLVNKIENAYDDSDYIFLFDYAYGKDGINTGISMEVEAYNEVSTFLVTINGQSLSMSPSDFYYEEYREKDSGYWTAWFKTKFLDLDIEYDMLFKE